MLYIGGVDIGTEIGRWGVEVRKTSGALGITGRTGCERGGIGMKTGGAMRA